MSNAAIDTDRLLPIVIGAHLAAEREHRPIGYRLCEMIERRNVDDGLEPIVCSDIWYMNQRDLMQRPTIAIGGPGVNAATAWIANRVPTAFVLEGMFQVAHDVGLSRMQAAAWGRDLPATEAAVACFIDRYLERFLRRAAGILLP